MNASLPRWLARPLDWLLGTLAVFFGASSLLVPFGPDQGLYFYVAREWLERDAVPYRDLFDHKTPGIYLLHYITIVLLGERQSSIRIADLACVVALGLITARLATPRGQRIPSGRAGGAVLVASLLHYGFFNYWDTAQSELWYATFGLAALCGAVRIERLRLASVVTGIASGAAILMKPPAAGFMVIAMGGLVLRMRPEARWRSVALAVSVQAGATIAVVASVIGYFAARGALGAMLDIVVGANTYYVEHEAGVGSASDVWDRVVDFGASLQPTGLLLGVTVVAGLASGLRGDRARLGPYGTALAMTVAAVAAVVVQKKFYNLHWVAVIAPMTFAGTLFVTEATPWIACRLPASLPKREQIGQVAAIVLVALAVAMSARFRSGWLHQTKLAAGRLVGTTTEEEYARSFRLPEFDFVYADIENLGRFIREHSSPDDPILVRGFNPGVYVVAQRHYGGRFFWSNFLTDPHRAYRRSDYLAEDREDFERIRPKYVVTLTYAEGNLEASNAYVAAGYVRVRTFGTLELLERTPAQ